MRKIMMAVLTWLVFVGCGPLDPLLIIPPIVNGYIYWKDGEATKYYNAEASEAYAGIKKAVAFYDHTISSDEIKDKGYLIISNSKNHKFRISITQTDPKVTCVKIRIDFLGDKPYAELIYRKLDEYLGTKTLGVKKIG